MESNDKTMNGTYNSYSAPQVLYLTSSYLNGNGLQNPSDYGQPTDPEEQSSFTKNSYSIYDYMKMGGIVKEFMDKNGRAPNYIEYEGAKIGYYDLVYNFAKITENHTDNSHMDFAREYHFDKVNESISKKMIETAEKIPTVPPVLRKNGEINNYERKSYVSNTESDR